MDGGEPEVRVELMKALSLFSGIGGLDCAAEMAGISTAAMCESDPFCRKVLRKHWPSMTIFDDIRKLEVKNIAAPIGIIHGGFPCQPFSLAGHKKGRDDDRYLWPEFSRLVREIEPRYVVAENVSGILNIAADEICADLESLGYAVGVCSFEAAALGAPHRRARVFFIAAHSGRGVREGGAIQEAIRAEYERGKVADHQRPSDAPDAYASAQGFPDGTGRSERQQEQCRSVAEGREREAFGRSECGSWREFKPGVGGVADGLPRWLDGYWINEADIPRTAKGIKNRVARLRALGNAVVPAQAYPIFRAIAETESRYNDVFQEA
jgi:DNA (cytosine-5)-methyltransferase 1